MIIVIAQIIESVCLNLSGKNELWFAVHKFTIQKDKFLDENAFFKLMV